MGRNLFSGLVEYNLSLGPKYSFDIGRARMIMAAGYEIARATIFVFGGAASASSWAMIPASIIGGTDLFLRLT